MNVNLYICIFSVDVVILMERKPKWDVVWDCNIFEGYFRTEC